MNDNRKQSLYFSREMLDQLTDQAVRLDRSKSWIIQQAWKIALGEIERLPSQRVAAYP